MIRIIGSFVSPYVRKVLACLNLKGLAYEVDPITPFFGNDEFERLSPLRRIPVLIDGDFAISNSSVICAYLDEAYPGHPLFPADPRDRARARWLEEYRRHPARRRVHLGLLLPEGRAPAGVGGAGRRGADRETLNEDIPAALDYLEAQLPADGFLFGEIGAADIAIASFFRNGAYAGFEPDAARWPRTQAFVERDARPSGASPSLLKFEDVQRSAEIRGRRQALLDAGAPLTAETMGLREPSRGMMRL